MLKAGRSTLCALRQFGSGLMQVTRQPVRGLLAERNNALFSALASHVNELLLEVDVSEIQVDGFATAQAGRVDELAQGAVSQAERAVALQPGKLRVHVFRLRSIGQPPRPPRGEGGIRNPLGPERETNERSHRGELARDRGGGQLRAPPAQIGGVIRKRANVHVVELQTAA